MKTVKRRRNSGILCFVLTAVLVGCLGLLFGTNRVQAWNGQASSKFASGSGTESSPYVIQSQWQMGFFLNQLNAGETFENKYISLDVDLNMTDPGGYIWTYNKEASFAGTFLGNAHTVRTDWTLFPEIAETGRIIGLNIHTLSDTAELKTISRALLCETNRGLIQMCCMRGSVTDEADSAAAGLICIDNYGTIQYCGAVGNVSAVGKTDACAAMVARNSGKISGCFAAVSASASASVADGAAYSDPLAYPDCGISEGDAKNYYNTTLYTDITATGRGFTSTEMKSPAFLNAMAVHVIPGYGWEVKSDGVLADGYPTVVKCGTVSLIFQDVEGDVTVYNSTSINCTLKTDTAVSGYIYYTTDGSDPRKHGTRLTLDQNSFTLSVQGEKVIRAAFRVSNGDFGPVTQHTFIYLPGNGTKSNPYLITTKRQLDAVRLAPDKYYKLGNNLTYYDADFALGGVAGGGWVPIPKFSGTFDGNTCAIIGLRGVSGGFMDSNTGTIKSLRMIDHQLSGQEYSGAVANVNAGTITRCYAKSAFTPENMPPVTELNTENPSYTGGLVGWNTGTVSYSRVDGTVAANSARKYGKIAVGGIVGYGSADFCLSNAEIISYFSFGLDRLHAGGIAGESDTDVEQCLSRVHFDFVSGIADSVYIGGIAGGCGDAGAVGCLAGTYSLTGISPGENGLHEYAFANNAADCYKSESAVLPGDCPALNFTDDWMLTDAGIIPQGIMDELGHCCSVQSLTEPACETDGSVILQCNLCEWTKSHTLSSTGHRPVTDAASDPTCTALGKSAGSHCARCGYVILAQEPIDQLPHDYTDRVCSMCGGGVPALAFGTCGDNLLWELGEDGVLIITGSGAMWDWSPESPSPWNAFCTSVKEVILPEKLTSVGAYAFSGCSSLPEIALSADIVSIGSEAFADCSGLSISGYTGTAVHAYASANGISFVPLNLHAETPVISVNPSSAAYRVGESAAALTVSASVSDGGELSWQWYKALSPEDAGELIPGAKSEFYTPDISAVGTAYYYAVVTNTNEALSGTTDASVSSARAEITVSRRLYIICGTVTSENGGTVSIELLQNGENVPDVLITVDVDSYMITGVPAGEYTLRVSKEKHVTREYTVIITEP